MVIKYLCKTTDRDWVETHDLTEVYDTLDRKYEFPVIYAFKKDETTGDFTAYYYEYLKFGRRVYVDLR